MKKLTMKQKKFVDKYIETGNGTKAAKESYDVNNDVTAASIAYENLNKPQIQARLARMVDGAVSRIEVLSMTAESEQVRLAANKDIVDRGIGKAKESLDVTTLGKAVSGNAIDAIYNKIFK